MWGDRRRAPTIGRKRTKQASSPPTLAKLRTALLKRERKGNLRVVHARCSKVLRGVQRFKGAQKSMVEKRDFMKANALCFGCLKWGHMKKDYRRRRVCKTCNRFHPTSLHSDPVKLAKQDRLANVPEATSCRVNVRDKKSEGASYTHSLIVPVWVHHNKDPNNKVLTYALLDEQSDVFFANENILHALNANGPEVELKLSTDLAEKVITSRKIDGLVVRGYKEDVDIPLPKNYSRSTIRARKDQIPRPESALGWPHLQKVSEKVMAFRSDVEFSLLIGLNCPRATKPLEVVPGKGGSSIRKENRPWMGETLAQ